MIRHRTALGGGPKQHSQQHHHPANASDVETPPQDHDNDTRSTKQLKKIRSTLLLPQLPIPLLFATHPRIKYAILLTLLGVAFIAGWTTIALHNSQQNENHRRTTLAPLSSFHNTNSNNPTRLYPNATRLWITASASDSSSVTGGSNRKVKVPQQSYELPTNLEWVHNYKGCAAPKVDGPKYLRDISQIENRRDSENYGNTKKKCGGAMEVFEWITSQVFQGKGEDEVGTTTFVKHDGENETQDEDHVMMIAYGDLIHLHREKDFVNATTGEFYDDDIDLWVSLPTLATITQLERQLFHQFGWTMRLIVTKKEVIKPWGYPYLRSSYIAEGGDKEYVAFAQLFAVCGHVIDDKFSEKIVSDEPTIDLYPIVTIPVLEKEEGKEGDDDGDNQHDDWGRFGGIVARLLQQFFFQTTTAPKVAIADEGTTPTTKPTTNTAAAHSTTTAATTSTTKYIVKDLWQGNSFSESLLFPRKRFDFVTAGLDHNTPIPLQLPHRELQIMECLYGDWTVPSSNHSGMAVACRDNVSFIS